jgi:hypothetical protein
MEGAADMALTDDVLDRRADPVPPPPPPGAVPDRHQVARAVALGGFAGALFWSLFAWGLPLDREVILLWVAAGLVCASIGRSWGQIARVVRDWLPLAAVLVVYDLSRGAADGLGRTVQVRPQIEVDRWIGFGHVPTVWLQKTLLDPRNVAWWEVVVTAMYVSHFIVPFAVAGVLWFRDRRRWFAYMGRFVTLSFLGAATFMLIPAAPPWMASRFGVIGPVARSAARGWEVVGLQSAGRVLEHGQASVNLVAAIPSLHAAYALLVCTTLWPTVRPAWRAVLVSYAVGMGFVLVLTGEHYVIDVLVGWAYVLVVELLWRGGERLAEERAGRQVAQGRSPKRSRWTTSPTGRRVVGP